MASSVHFGLQAGKSFTYRHCPVKLSFCTAPSCTHTTRPCNLGRDRTLPRWSAGRRAGGAAGAAGHCDDGRQSAFDRHRGRITSLVHMNAADGRRSTRSSISESSNHLHRAHFRPKRTAAQRHQPVDVGRPARAERLGTA